MTNSMVERLAKVISVELDGPDPIRPDGLDTSLFPMETYRNIARSCLAAMREPTLEMTAAFMSDPFGATKDAYQAAIDEALK